MSERVPAYTADQVRAAEAPLLAAGEPLMARAAAALAAIVREEMTDAASARILVLAGSGDNGGDAMLAAASLLEGDEVDIAEVDVLRVGTRAHEGGVTAATGAGARLIDVTALEALESYDLVIDGILGIGTSGDPTLRGTARVAVEALLPAVRAGETRVIAADLPSGLHPDTGATADEFVLPADVTVTFGALKAGLARGRGPALAGRVVLVDLGLGPRLAGEKPAVAASVSRILAG